ncbi:M17 family metallopeptidase [Parvularcula sp. IMCC14364]|uniref:leucyl aminopeptidase family protein n=1 Tax=Parvularcula sp. IMCC14364 TaxID=3067902 RepID=UPI00274143F0|nr:leucyl aminopeptidase [Parvularcula sp. IMCC14364]
MPATHKIIAAASLAIAAMLAPAHAQPSFSFSAPDSDIDGDIVLMVGEGLDMTATMTAVDAATSGRLTAALEQADFTGSFGASLKLHAMSPYETIVVIGTGEEELTPRKLTDLGGHAAAHSGDDVTVLADNLDTDVEAAGAWLAKGFALRSYSFDKYKSGDDADDTEQFVTVMSAAPAAATELYTGDLQYVVEGVTFARDIGTEPGNKVYPEVVADRVRTLFSGVRNVRIDVLDAQDIRREGMGSLMGVGMGSINDPRLVVIRYNGAGTDEAPIALVGKGITFDTGGISIKPNNGMWLMKSDLSGAVAVAGSVYAAAKRQAPVNIVGLMPLAENMPGRDAIRPGDVLTTMGGKTIEIISTDAEGRLVLADAVQYAQEEFNPRLLLNIATLTGSAARAVGDDYAVVITRDLETSLDMMEIGERAGEDVWPLPLHPSHFDQIKSDIADIKNTGGSPGASIGAAVVGTFIDEDQPWVHLDIAGVDWLNSDVATAPKGHAGWGVRFMDQLIREESE